MRVACAETTAESCRNGAGALDRRDDLVVPEHIRMFVEDLSDEVTRLMDVISAQRLEISRLRHDAVRDALTGLLNRRGFERVLERSISFVSRYSSDVSLVYADLNNFKHINDTLGHVAGDAALKHVASVLSGTLRRSDVVGRIGGDEFVALLWKTSAQEARAAALDVNRALAEAPFVFDGRPYTISASLGIACLCGEDRSGDVLDRADRDMYRAKTGLRL
ncbi:GGDEF domain-containing protein [Breoghania sp.]|uniref:GGDEF domain-containing protein n=1 Tax=Breoghania sp. TaxID=2065378 RepID=UPI002AA77BC9|nr:GGDEF domain-containing protein [Breoghania sp.]